MRGPAGTRGSQSGSTGRGISSATGDPLRRRILAAVRSPFGRGILSATGNPLRRRILSAAGSPLGRGILSATGNPLRRRPYVCTLYCAPILVHSTVCTHRAGGAKGSPLPTESRGPKDFPLPTKSGGAKDYPLPTRSRDRRDFALPPKSGGAKDPPLPTKSRGPCCHSGNPASLQGPAFLGILEDS